MPENAPMDAFKLVLVLLASWMDRQTTARDRIPAGVDEGVERAAGSPMANIPYLALQRLPQDPHEKSNSLQSNSSNHRVQMPLFMLLLAGDGQHHLHPLALQIEVHTNPHISYKKSLSA